MNQAPVVHEHKWWGTDPRHPDPNDRCRVCGMPRYEVMGPFARRKARMIAGYAEMGSRLH